MSLPSVSRLLGWLLKSTTADLKHGSGRNDCIPDERAGCSPNTSNKANHSAAAFIVPFVGGYYCGLEMIHLTEPEDGACEVMPTDRAEYVYVYERAKRRWFCTGSVNNECAGK